MDWDTSYLTSSLPLLVSLDMEDLDPLPTNNSGEKVPSPPQKIQMVEVEGAGHAVHIEAPMAVVSAIRVFVDSL